MLKIVNLFKAWYYWFKIPKETELDFIKSKLFRFYYSFWVSMWLFFKNKLYHVFHRPKYITFNF